MLFFTLIVETGLKRNRNNPTKCRNPEQHLFRKYLILVQKLENQTPIQSEDLFFLRTPDFADKNEETWSIGLKALRISKKSKNMPQPEER